MDDFKPYSAHCPSTRGLVNDGTSYLLKKSKDKEKTQERIHSEMGHPPCGKREIVVSPS